MKPSPPTFVDFATRALGLALTPAQRELAAVSFDGAAIPPEFADLFGFEGEVPASARSVIGWLCGRGSGKTRLASAYVLWRVLFAPASGIGKGEIAFGAIVSPTVELSQQAIRFARGMLEGTPFERLIIAETSTSFTLKRPDGKTVRVTAFAAARGGASGRGKSILAACLDECCFFRDQSSVVNDADIYRAILPRLVSGGAIVLPSTPWVQSGLLFDLWKGNFGTPQTALVALAPTQRMRTDDAELLARIEAERLRDPENAAREFDCQWLPHGAGNAFDLESLTRSIVEETAAKSFEPVYIGGDLGLVNDPSAFVAVQKQGPGEFAPIAVLDVLEIKPRRGTALSLRQVLRDAEAFARRWGVSVIRVDHHSLAEARDAIQAERLSITLEPASEAAPDRQGRFASLVQAFKDGRVSIPRQHAALTDQLARIVATPRTGGGFAFSATRQGGNHADAAMALILAADWVFQPARHGALLTAFLENAPGLIAASAPGARVPRTLAQQVEDEKARFQAANGGSGDWAQGESPTREEVDGYGHRHFF